MQVIYKDKDKKSSSRRANIVDLVLYTRRISRYMKGKYVGRFGS